LKPDTPSPSSLPCRIALVAALIAFGFSTVLALESAGNASLPGCGDPSKGCLSVLQSPWSKLLGLPVAVLSVAFYASLSVLLFIQPIPSEDDDPPNGGFGVKTLLFLATAAGAAALYFTGIQAFVLKTFCPYCCAAHAAGLVMVVSIFLAFRNKNSQTISPHKPSIATGFIAVVLFAAVQISYPTEPTPAAPAQHLSFIDTGPGPDRQLTLPSAKPGAGVRVNPHQLPIHGNPDAPVVALLAHDYTCGLCSVAHLAMNAAILSHTLP